ncbi:photoreceptor disk component PRCD isoform X2 [Herpailurus yagouaroundi]|uniref:photoreceptor disk component PRCD isoform X2 n=1 Tax=Herpailurus yagouaroundi TaxID=1608482 RepID=UPI001AD68C97|nr:photoreceptor disk component PRCD isoform X2 [Puma yagouaroundi]
MCTTLFLLSTLAMLWRRRFANRVQPEPSGLDGAVVGSNVDTDLQSSGRKSLRSKSSSLQAELGPGDCDQLAEHVPGACNITHLVVGASDEGGQCPTCQ